MFVQVGIDGAIEVQCAGLYGGANLGLDLVRADPAEADFESDPRIDALLAERQQARSDKDWATADRIRDELTASGIEIIDTPGGARWRRK